MERRENNALGNGLLVNLEDVNGHAASRGELLVADMAFEVLGLLVLDQDLLVVELSVAVVAPHLLRSLLLLPHRLTLLPSASASDLPPRKDGR